MAITKEVVIQLKFDDDSEITFGWVRPEKIEQLRGEDSIVGEIIKREEGVWPAK